MPNLLKSLFILIILSSSLFANLQKISLQLEWKHQFEFAGFYAAIEKGYYKEIGLELEIKEFQKGINISQDVIDGKSTFGIASSALILERLKNKPVVLIASYFKQNALALVTKTDIKNPLDLKNKKIMALEGEMDHTSLGVLLKDYGVTKDDYTLVPHDFKIDKFVKGEVDAMSIFITSQLYELDNLGINYEILNPSNFGIYSYDVELFTSEKTINKNQKMVEDFVKATNKGWEYAFKNKKEIVDLIYDKYTKRKTKESLFYEANQTEKIFKTNIFKIGAIAPELIKLNADLYKKLNLVDKNSNINTILNSYYLTDDYKKEIVLTEEELLNLKRNWLNPHSTIDLTKAEKNYLKTKKSITMCVDPDWEPFEKINSKGIHEGIAADIINLLSAKLGIEIKLVPTKNWEESLAFSKENKCDILSFLNETPKRKEWLNFTEPIFEDPNVIVGRIENDEIKDLSKIKASIALPKGTAMSELFAKDFPNLIIIPTNSEDESFKLLENKKADLTMRSMIITAYTIKKNNLFNLKILNQPKGYENYLRIGVLKQDLILLDILNKGISKIEKNEIENIVNKWVVIKFEKIEDYTYFWILFIILLVLTIFFLYRQYLLKLTNKYLKDEVTKRTQELENSNLILEQNKNELYNLNKNLKIKIKEEVEKNKLIQEKLYKADKLASMGEMISNIAHQWRQPLSVISTVATGIKLQKEFNNLKDEDLLLNMDLINKNAQYLSETIDDFKNFIKDDRKLQSYNLSNTIHHFIHLIDSSIKHSNIHLILNLDKNIFIKGYPNELMQCLINIFNNSKDAYEETKQKYPLFFIETKQFKNAVFIKIKDNAGGISEDIISKIYDPYFTTKHKSQGTGLGLNMTYKLITEGANGKIDATNVEYEYENILYKGVEFKITIEI